MAPHFLHSLILLHLLTAFPALVISELPGKWEILVENAGIASMHTAVTRFGTVVLLDRTDNGPTKIKLPNNRCRNDPNEKWLKHDCYAHSVLFDPETNKIRPLTIKTDTWCSSGAFLPDGTLLQTGGDFDGLKKIRKFVPCPRDGLCDWIEIQGMGLQIGRWYATNQLLPDGKVIIIGGRDATNIEFYPPATGVIDFPFLREAEDYQLDNLYPYVHLLPNGHLFIFANTKSVLYDYKSNKVLHNYPELEGGPRNYPSAGSSAMLALNSKNGFSKAEILVCGGAKFGAFIYRTINSVAHRSCGRIEATDLSAKWEMEDMPFPRIMGDMITLPTGEILIINGAQSGSQGFEMASNPCLNPVLYKPDAKPGSRFLIMKPTSIPRMYHSTAVLLPDGRVLLAGSNPHYAYRFNKEFPTELRLEAFSPDYLSSNHANLRPVIVVAPATIHYGKGFHVEVEVGQPLVEKVEVNLVSAPFSSHSLSQGQRLVKLEVSIPIPSGSRYTISCTAPSSSTVAPPSYYMMFVVNQGVPSAASWVQIAY